MVKGARKEPAGPAAEELLGPLEASCLRSLWASAPATVGEVLETVNADHDPALAYTTVMTVLSRLYEKGYVTRERHGRGYAYRPSYTEQELIDVLGAREVDRVVERYGEVAIAHFADALERADPQLLARVEALRHGGTP